MAAPLPVIERVPPVDDEDDEPAQFDVVALVEPEPVLERVPVPVQSLLFDRCLDSSIEPAMPLLFCVP
jgi:hypothetical protein